MYRLYKNVGVGPLEPVASGESDVKDWKFAVAGAAFTFTRVVVCSSGSGKVAL